MNITIFILKREQFLTFSSSFSENAKRKLSHSWNIHFISPCRWQSTFLQGISRSYKKINASSWVGSTRSTPIKRATYCDYHASFTRYEQTTFQEDWNLPNFSDSLNYIFYISQYLFLIPFSPLEEHFPTIAATSFGTIWITCALGLKIICLHTINSVLLFIRLDFKQIA